MPEDYSYLDKFITGKGEVLPAELGKQYLADLDAALARQQTRGMESVLGETESRGFLRSGQSLQNVAEQVLGPAEERRRSALLGLVREAAGAGREERLGTTAFERQRQLAGEDFERQLALLTRQNDLRRSLAILEAELSGESTEGGFGELMGGVLGTGLGVLAGKMGGSIGGAIGGGIGSKIGGIGSKIGGLFGREEKKGG